MLDRLVTDSIFACGLLRLESSDRIVVLCFGEICSHGGGGSCLFLGLGLQLCSNFLSSVRWDCGCALCLKGIWKKVGCPFSSMEIVLSQYCRSTSGSNIFV